ncbi:MAG: enoyl-CoA hydratase/isomerase family protein [Deltaproteobacteria bacterium]|nr:enoyl-CoA hydratase/isomerase family protein [Deltaproteobacteria bacterium]
MGSEVIFEKRDGTAWVVLNRPEQNNAINLALRQGLRDAWEEIERDRDILSVIVTGGERVFSTGQDVKELAAFKETDPLADLPLNDLRTFGAEVKKPIIAAISGHCLGFGFLLTMTAADIRVASDTARFGMPEIRIGVPPSLGIPAIVARHFPPAMAAELFLTGESITVEDAYRAGYVNRIVSPGELEAAAEEYARRINAFSPLIAGNVKEVLRRVTAPDPRDVAFSEAMCVLGRHSEDYLEGPRAFRENRKPVWKGR